MVAGIGALAVVGFEPVATLARFEYVTLGLSLLGAFAVVYRLGAGLHGLGRRGVVTVLIGTVVLAVTLAYAELLRRHGTPSLVDGLLDGVAWSRDHLGAFRAPSRPCSASRPGLGHPHARAWRRQGWWVCAFGVAATTPIANALVSPPSRSRRPAWPSCTASWSACSWGFVVIRMDLALTGSPGRRGRRAEGHGLRPGRPAPARCSEGPRPPRGRSAR